MNIIVLIFLLIIFVSVVYILLKIYNCYKYGSKQIYSDSIKYK